MAVNKNAQYRASVPTFIDGSDVILQTTSNGDLKVALDTTLDDVNDSITTYPKCTYINLVASGLVKTGAGQAYGIWVSAHTTGTLKLWDNTSAATTVYGNTFTFAAGSSFIPLPGGTFNTGLFATIGGTGVDITIFYR